MAIDWNSFLPPQPTDYSYLDMMDRLRGVATPPRQNPRRPRNTSQPPNPIVAPQRRPPQPPVIPGYGVTSRTNTPYGTPPSGAGGNRPQGQGLLQTLLNAFIGAPMGAMAGAPSAFRNFANLGNQTPSVDTIRQLAAEQAARGNRVPGIPGAAAADNPAAGGGRNSRRGGGGSFGLPTGQEEPVGDATIPMFGRTLQDYLNGVDPNMFIAGDMAALDAQASAAQGQGRQNMDELARIYAWLVSQIRGQDEQINRQYAQGQAQSRENMQAATNAVSQGGQATDSQLAEAFGNLGIDRASGSGNLAANTSAQLGDFAARGQINADYLGSRGMTQRDLNRENATAAGFRGAEEQAALARQLAQFMAELQSKRASLRSTGMSEAMDYARQLYEADRTAFNDERAYADRRDDEAWNRSMDSSRLRLAQNEDTRAAAAASQSQQQLSPFDSIGQTLATRLGPQVADQILSLVTEEARKGRSASTPNGFAGNVYRAAVKAGMSPAVALQAHAAAENYWQAYRS